MLPLTCNVLLPFRPSRLPRPWLAGHYGDSRLAFSPSRRFHPFPPVRERALRRVKIITGIILFFTGKKLFFTGIIFPTWGLDFRSLWIGNSSLWIEIPSRRTGIPSRRLGFPIRAGLFPGWGGRGFLPIRAYTIRGSRESL